jgi:hypothetical protein
VTSVTRVEHRNCQKSLAHLNSLRTDSDFCHQGGTQKLAQKTKDRRNMTIHWKGLEEHFLMVPLVFRFNHFGEIKFSEFFSKKPQSLKSIKARFFVFLWCIKKLPKFIQIDWFCGVAVHNCTEMNNDQNNNQILMYRLQQQLYSNLNLIFQTSQFKSVLLPLCKLPSKFTFVGLKNAAPPPSPACY